MDYLIHEKAATPELHWRLSMALSVLAPLLFCMLYGCIPESPRFLVAKGREGEALKIISDLRVEGTWRAAGWLGFLFSR